MKFGAAILMAALLALSAFAGARVVVPSLPEAVTPDAEVSTNIALNVDAARLQTLTFSVAFDSCETNEVLVAIGADGDNDGDLSLDEAAGVFGCDCGEWYRAVLRIGTASTEGSDFSVEDPLYMIRLPAAPCFYTIYTFYTAKTYLEKSLLLCVKNKPRQLP